MNIGVTILWIIIGIFGVAVLWWVLSRIYQRSRSDVAFVRTGFLGRKIVITGGAFVVPILHEVTGVNMNAVRFDVDRTGANALITKDRLRVDILASFNVRVGRTPEDVLAAAQTFGKRTLQVDVLRNLLEAGFVDALRSAAAEMTLAELHQHRKEIGDRVTDIVAPGLTHAGLELLNLSITKLDQADRSFFNADNSFDAAGLTALTETIESLRQKRHQIETATQVAIERKDLESERERLDISKEKEFADLEHRKYLAIRRFEEDLETSKAEAKVKLEKDVSELTYQKDSENTRLDIENQIEELRARAMEQREKVRIETEKTVQSEQAEADRILRQLEIAIAQDIEAGEIEREKQIKIARQKLETEVSEQERLVAEVRIATEQMREKLAKAEETVAGAKDIVRAEIEKSVDQLASERQAAAMSIIAEAESNVEKLRAISTELRLKAEATGLHAQNEADNVLSVDTQAMRIRLHTIDKLEGIIRESVKPLENIEGMKIFDVRGFGGAQGSVSGSGGSSGGDNLSDQLVNAALRYRGQGPLVDKLLAEVGLSDGKLRNLEDLVETKPSATPSTDDDE